MHRAARYQELSRYWTFNENKRARTNVKNVLRISIADNCFAGAFNFGNLLNYCFGIKTRINPISMLPWRRIFIIAHSERVDNRIMFPKRSRSSAFNLKKLALCMVWLEKRRFFLGAMKKMVVAHFVLRAEKILKHFPDVLEKIITIRSSASSLQRASEILETKWE